MPLVEPRGVVTHLGRFFLKAIVLALQPVVEEIVDQSVVVESRVAHVALADDRLFLGGVKTAVGSRSDDNILVPRDLGVSRSADQPLEVVWEIELLSLFQDPELPPADLGAIPADATATETGASFKVVRPGIGKRHPTPDDVVVLNYSVWTTDGTVIDTSFNYFKPVGLRLGEEMPESWVGMISQMVEGERRRVWFPSGHGMTGPEGGELGMLVFDVDLLKID